MRTALAALLMFAPAAAHAAGASDITAATRKVDGLLDSWRFGQADAALEALRKTAPNAPEVSYLDGYSKFMHGDYDGAAKALATAASAANASPDVKMLAELAKEARDAIKDHKEERTAHIVIRYPAEDAVLVPYARDTLEAAYQALHDDLGFDAEIPIRVEFYRSPSDLASVSSLSQAEVARTGTIALCKWARLMVTTPRALAYGYPWLDSINHELVHYAVSTLTGDRAPVWLQEGLAKFLETRWRGAPGMAVDDMSISLLQEAAKKDKLIPFAKMHPSIAMLPTQEQAALAFAEVEAAIRLLYQRGGQAALTELVSAMASGMTDEQAVAQAYGKSFEEFEADWRVELRKPRAKAVSQKAVRPSVAKKLVFKEDAKGRAEPPPLEAAVAETPPDQEGKRAARLGEIFYSRRRWAAAVKEYARARQRVPREVPLIARRYAFAQMQLGRFPEAEEALRSAVERDPDDEAAQALYARVLLKRGALDKARLALDNGIAVDPFDPDLHATYVEVAKGLKDPALEERERNAVALAAGDAHHE